MAGSCGSAVAVVQRCRWCASWLGNGYTENHERQPFTQHNHRAKSLQHDSHQGWDAPCTAEHSLCLCLAHKLLWLLLTAYYLAGGPDLQAWSVLAARMPCGNNCRAATLNGRNSHHTQQATPVGAVAEQGRETERERQSERETGSPSQQTRTAAAGKEYQQPTAKQLLSHPAG